MTRDPFSRAAAWTLRVVVGGIYQKFLSPVLHFMSGPLGGCRFQPSCSNYFLQAVDLHGPWKGTWLGLRRIFRCHPWGGQGYDPVPPPRTSASDPH